MRCISTSFVAILVIIAAPIFPPSAFARIALADYRDIGITVPENASVPFSARVVDAAGQVHNLRELISRPTVLVFADYTCRTLCGPVVDFVGSALEKSGLHPGDQFQFLVVGLDPKDTAMDAAEMRRAHIEAGSSLEKATEFVTTDQSTILGMTAALGYHYKYDEDDDQFVHPAAGYVLGADGHVVRVLTGIGLSGAQMRLALIEASAGKIGTFRVLRTDTALRARACTRAREIIEEFSLGSIASPVRPTVSRPRRYHIDHADVGAGLVGAAIGQR